MQPSDEEIKAGQAVYSKKILSAYDILVLGISNRFLWKCPTPLLIQHYNKNISNNHLDVGVGTGYFLDRCQLPSSSPRIALMDLNQNTLDFASHRIQRYQPETYQQNILEPITQEIATFDSLGVNYLFHCLPGALAEKMIALDYLSPLLKANATVFGSTILGADLDQVPNLGARKLMGFYNKKKIFSNQQDSLSELSDNLKQRLSNVQIQTHGCVALFSGTKALSNNES